MNTHFLRGQVLLEQERYLAAAEEFKQALALAPDEGFLHGMLAIALMNGGRWQEALREAQTAVEKSPNESQAHATLGIVWLNRGYYKQAEESIRQAIELDPEDADSFGLLARILCETNRNEKALEAAEAGLSIDAASDLCLTFRARALIGLGKSGDAHDVTDTLLRENPLDAWNHYLKGDQLLTQGKAQEARIHYLEALRLDPSNEGARVGLVQSLKARSPIFAFFLGVLIRLGRIRPAVVWTSLILLFVGLRVLDSIVPQFPALIVPYEILRIALYASVVLITIANPVFDLLLRFDREGRTALSEDEYRATNWYLVCFGLAGLCAVWAVTTQKAFLPKIYGYSFLFHCKAVGEVFESSRGCVRMRMAWLTGFFGLGLVLLASVAASGLIAQWIVGSGGSLVWLIKVVAYFPLASIIFSGFSDNVREWLERRRPDSENL